MLVSEWDRNLFQCFNGGNWSLKESLLRLLVISDLYPGVSIAGKATGMFR